MKYLGVVTIDPTEQQPKALSINAQGKRSCNLRSFSAPLFLPSSATYTRLRRILREAKNRKNVAESKVVMEKYTIPEVNNEAEWLHLTAQSCFKQVSFTSITENMYFFRPGRKKICSLYNIIGSF